MPPALPPNNVFALPQTSCVRHVNDPQYGTVIDYWVPVRTGDWARDNALGRSYARHEIQAMQKSGSTIRLVAIMRAIVSKGHYDGVEAGFVQEVASRVLETEA